MAQSPLGNLRRPSKALIALMVTIGLSWVVLSEAVDLSASGRAVFQGLVGDSVGVFHGQLWRLFTAPLLHAPNQPLAPLFSALMLYFFVPSLEDRWGLKRTYLFLFGSAAFAYAFEALTFVLLPSLANGQWYGAMVMADAALVAWAMQNRKQVIYFMLVVPLKPLLMVGLLLAWHVVSVLMHTTGSDGIIAPLAAALSGWLFCDGGPGRRAYLRLKLRRLQNQMRQLRRPATGSKRKAPHLRVIQGGAADDDKPLH